MFRPEVEVFVEHDALADRAAALFAGARSIALSRPTPAVVFERINDAGVLRDAHVFQVDERQAIRGTDDRNLTLIERTVARWVGGSNVHEMPVDAPDLCAAAGRYGDELRSVCGDPIVIDVIHVGLGPDGHTASLLPGDPVLEVDDRAVAVTEVHGGFRRMTLTYPVIDAARLVVLIVCGAHKAEALARVLAGDRSAPAARLTARSAVVLADEEAAARI